MSIQSEITRISGNVTNAFTAIANKGVSIPSGSNSDDLATLIGQIPQDITMGAVSVVDAPDSAGGTVRTITGVDISSDTVTAAHLETGYTAHDAEGNPIVGVLSPGNVTVESMSISLNGTYTAPSGTAYSPVIVNVPASAVDSGTKSITSNGSNQDVVGYAAVDVAVPNSYTAGDEGKVVSNGELVAQSSDSVTQNGTVDTTLINSLTVNVSGGGGGQIATGSITLAADTVGNDMPIIDVGFDYSHILVYPSATHVGYGGRSSGLILYWTDGTSTYAAGVSTNSGGSSSSGGDVAVHTGGSALAGVIGQKIGNTFKFAGTSAWNGYFRAALTWNWVAW